MYSSTIVFFIFFLNVFIYETTAKAIVLWHGMGDFYSNPDSMGKIIDIIKDELPDTFVHSIAVAETPNDDRNAGFFGIINKQVDYVCEQLVKIPELSDGFDAIGFSQGGLFLRAYVQRCNRPKVQTLITFGSPHGGVSDIPNCTDKFDFKCTLMRSMVKGGVYTDYVQHHVIQAQYYKDPSNIKRYLEHNIFLPSINNELNIKNTTYRDQLSSLENFIMVKFNNDTMIKPSESAWFWTFEEEYKLIPLEDQDIYNQDWLGLQILNQQGKLKFLECPGTHMHIADDYFVKEIIQKYLLHDIKKQFYLQRQQQ
jgi:palmitoyl-protein thioesterase